MTAGRRSTTVAVDANPAVRDVQTGTEAYAREVSRRLPDVAPDLRFIFYVSRPSEIAGVDLTVLPGRRMWSQLRLPVELWNRRPNVFFAPSHVVPFLAPGRTTLVTASMADKDVPGVVRALASARSLQDASIVTTQVDLARALPAADLAAIWRSIGGGGRTVTAEPEPGRALDRALAGPPGPIVVAGSLYLVGAVRARLVDDPLLRDPMDNRP